MNAAEAMQAAFTADKKRQAWTVFLDTAEMRLAALNRSVEKAERLLNRLRLSVEGDTRDPACVQRWPECEAGAFDPRCCRFPKSCSPSSVEGDTSE